MNLNGHSDHQERSSRIVSGFAEKSQELTIIARRKSSNIVVELKDLVEFAFELQNFQLKPIEEVAAAIGTSIVRGLQPKEAAKRISQMGPNEVKPPRDWPLWAKFLLSFTSGFAPLLWVAAVLVFVSWQPFCPTCLYNLMLAVMLLAVIVVSSVFSFYQEMQATSMLSGFQNLVPTDCFVIRDGNTIQIPANELALGDLVCLQTGSRVPADMRIISTAGLKLDKSMLTGESEPSSATCDPADPSISYLEAKNIAFMGCNVVEGEGKGIVVAIGADNQLAKIMGQIALPEELTSLQVEVNRLVYIIGSLAFITAVVAVIEWALYLNVEHKGFMTLSTMLANAISVVVAYVPEGLPLALSMGLTIIARRLCARHFVLVKRLGTIETLGSISMLASDKTGTLTENKMTVTGIISSDNISFDSSKEVPNITEDTTASSIAYLDGVDPLELSYRIATFCNQAALEEEASPSVDAILKSNPAAHIEPARRKRVAVGSNATDRALLQWVDQSTTAVAPDYMNTSFPGYEVLATLPFSSVTKLTAVVVRKVDSGDRFVFVKGAPEYILPRCLNYVISAIKRGDKIKTLPLTQQFQVKMSQSIAVESDKGRRVIALAQIGPLDTDSFHSSLKFTASPTPNFPLTNLTFVSCACISDPPKATSKVAVEDLRKAGILVAMVTGDAAPTAVAISRQVGIVTEAEVSDMRMYDPAAVLTTTVVGTSAIKSGDIELGKYSTVGSAEAPSGALLVTGKDLDLLDEKAWDFIFQHKELVFARTTPEHKLAIVMEAQRRGHRVGVTGDGVNDSPALKRADVGVAMNNGSDVARDAAAIVLLHNDFAALPHAVKAGRLIFENLRKVVGYQFSAGCWAELLPVLATFFLGMPQPLSSFLMIIISCFTDVYAGVALTGEPAEDEIMLRPPRDVKKRRLLDLCLLGYSYLFYANMISIGCFYMYFHYMANRGPTGGIPTPTPADDDGNGVFPAGYTATQLLGAWNWALGDGPLADDQIEASAVASSVFFVGIVTSQMFHLLSIRRKTPYFYHSIMGAGKYANDARHVLQRLWDEIACVPHEIRWPVVAAWVGSVATANFFNYVPVFNEWCGTAPVPGLYWGMGFGWAVLWFTIAEMRKWIIVAFPDSIVAKTAW